jgi:large subunit ribosomal protein L24
MSTLVKKIQIAKLHIKTGDTVQIIAGKDKGKSGTILQVFPTKQRAIVSECNMVTKHQKPTPGQPGSGDRFSKEASIHISNLMVVDPKTGTPTRIGRKLVDGKLVRYSKKSGEIL